uniref:Uncharacterized protein n=1 Tax=viral metagenome TaxID=1070528 RepID=A0A6C0BU53_9ZZZZ
MNNPPPNVFNQIVDDVFDGVDLPPIQENQNVPNEVAEYDQEFVRPLPPNKITDVIDDYRQLIPGNTYNKVMDNNTKFDINQMKYVEDRFKDGRFLQFENNLGNNNIPLNSDDRFIPAYKMLPESYPNRERYATNFFAIEGIHKEETSNDEDSSDESDSDSDMSVGGKKRRRNKKQKKFHFTSTQKHQYGGKKTVRHVSIKNGKGHKKVSHYRGNKLAGTVKKSLKKPEMEMIRLGKFIPGLFRDCQVSRKKGTTRRRRKKN